MGHRIGYACNNTRLAAEGVNTSRGMIRRTFDARGIEYASQLAVQNVTDLAKILEWNALNGVSVFRITSCLVPWASEFELDQLPDFEEFKGLLASCGKLAVETGQRLSFHPGPFNCLSSEDPRVVQNSIRDLRIHGEIADLLGLSRSHMSKINIHLGGRCGDGDRAMLNFARAFERLPESVRTRLTLENDDRPNLFSTRDLMEAHRMTGVPLVHDFHHHRFCDGGWTQQEALDAAMSTWPRDIRPVTHYSESASEVEGKKGVKPNAHSDYVVGPIPFPERDIDVVLEAKAKEDALIRYRNAWPSKHAGVALREITTDEVTQGRLVRLYEQTATEEFSVGPLEGEREGVSVRIGYTVPAGTPAVVLDTYTRPWTHRTDPHKVRVLVGGQQGWVYLHDCKVEVAQ